MSWRKDLKSKPKTGRHFPLRFGDAVKLVKEGELTQYDGSRLAIRMENIEHEYEYGHILIDILPEEDITVYSLPDTFEPELTKKAAFLALKALTKFRQKIENENCTSYSYFCAYLTDINIVTVTRKDIKKQKRKYRDSSKFSNAFKVSKVNVEEAVIEAIGI